MECKSILISSLCLSIKIKIYPEWNVNTLKVAFFKSYSHIKIYPEWNVNNEVDLLFQFMSSIKIYPEWNVNKSAGNTDWQKVKLKSIQSGM